MVGTLTRDAAKTSWAISGENPVACICVRLDAEYLANGAKYIVRVHRRILCNRIWSFQER